MATKTINESYEEVPIDYLKPHPRNVNQGDFGAILESVKANGFFGALVVQRSTNHILAGNHRYHVARSEGFETLPVIYVDVDDTEALRILLADNRTARLGQDDSAQLAALLAELSDEPGGLIGTGFDGDDLDRLIGDLADRPIGLDSTKDAERSTRTRDTGANPDGSRYAICPECNHEFEIKPARHARKTQ